MSLNTVPADSAARQPRSLVKINGELMPGWLSWDVEQNTFYAADTFRTTFAVSALDSKRGPDWWAAQTELFAEVFVGFPLDAENYTPTDLQSLIYGRVDDIDYDPVAQEISIAGRDLTSVMIDTKTTEKWINLTASEIASQIAASHGLTASVTPTAKKAGRYYEIDHVSLTEQRSEWDLLTYLAHQEGFVVYVAGKTLHFEAQSSPSDNPYVLKWEKPAGDNGFPTYNGKTLRFSRNLTLAKGATVTVRSWNQKSKAGFTQSYPRAARGTRAGQASPFGAQQNYTYVIPNLSPEKALQRAQALHKEITAHEVRMSASLPGDNILSARDVIQVTGTGTAYDQTYFPESIRRSMSVNGGYSMDVAAKNHNPLNEVAA